MRTKIALLIFSVVGANFAASAQFTNNGATISGSGNVLISSSMDIQNSGNLNLREGTLVLNGKRKVTSEQSIVVDNLLLTDPSELDADVMVHNLVDFGNAGLAQMVENRQITFGSDATYSNYGNGKGVKGGVKKLDAKSFVFPLGSETESFPTVVQDQLAVAEASIRTQKSIDLGDFADNSLESPNLAVIEVKSPSIMEANRLKLQFDESKEEVVLDNNAWVEASRAKPANTFVATKAISYNRGTALQTAENRWVEVYPNPSNGEINISILDKEALGEVNFRIVDQSGSVVKQEKKAGKDLVGKYSIPQHLGTSTYFLEFENQNGKRAVLKHVLTRQ